MNSRFIIAIDIDNNALPSSFEQIDRALSAMMDSNDNVNGYHILTVDGDANHSTLANHEPENKLADAISQIQQEL